MSSTMTAYAAEDNAAAEASLNQIVVLLFIFGGEIIAAIVAALAEAFAWLCGILELAYQFFVNWGPNLCPNY